MRSDIWEIITNREDEEDGDLFGLGDGNIRRLQDLRCELRKLLSHVSGQEIVIALRTGEIFRLPGTNFSLMPMIYADRPLTGLFHVFSGQHNLMVPLQRIAPGLGWTLQDQDFTVRFTVKGICRTRPQAMNLGGSGRGCMVTNDEESSENDVPFTFPIGNGFRGNFMNTQIQNQPQTQTSRNWILIGIQIRFRGRFIDLLEGRERRRDRRERRRRRRRTNNLCCL